MAESGGKRPRSAGESVSCEEGEQPAAVEAGAPPPPPPLVDGGATSSPSADAVAALALADAAAPPSPLTPGDAAAVAAPAAARPPRSGMQDANARTAFVGGLPLEVTEPLLRAFFEPYGALTSVRLISDGRTGRSKGYAFITFAEEASAVAVRALGRIAFQGRYVDVGAPCGPKPPGARHGIPTERRVFVGGLPREATEALMAAFFSAFGQVLEFKIVIDPVTGVSRGYGFVAFVHTASADCLKAMRSIDFFGKTLNVGEARKGGFHPASGGSLMDSHALAAAYIAAGYTVMPLQQYEEAHMGGMHMYAGYGHGGGAQAHAASAYAAALLNAQSDQHRRAVA